jgi:protein-S-isoprenylcysteine O-methyltransferase Ste14
MRTLEVRTLVGSGDRIARAVAPVAIVGVGLILLFPAWFSVGGPTEGWRNLSIAVLLVGVTEWIWSAVLILRHVPRGELITTGPFAVMKHPLYVGVSLLVLPWAGFLLNTWLGLVIGFAMYAATRRYAPEEERELAARFGAEYNAYIGRVWLPWL